MILFETEHRVIRKDAQGNRFEYSDKDNRPFGDGWQRVDPVKHPRAKVYMWFRPYNYVAKEYQERRRERPIISPTSLQIDPSLLPKLGVNFEDVLTNLRKEIRDTLSQAKHPYYTGDRVQVAGEKGIFYVKRIDDARGRVIVQDAANADRQLSVNMDQLERDFDMVPVPWTMGDNVTILGDAVGEKEPVEGTIIGFDHFTNKLRVALGGGASIEVFPEAVIGVRGKNADILKSAAKFLEENPSSMSGEDSRAVIDCLLRAVLEGREQVATTELFEDLKATQGKEIPLATIRGQLAAVASIFSGGLNHSVFFNPATDSVYLKDGQLAIRLLANSRNVKNTHKRFGWKNITEDNKDEVYAAVGQRVMFEEETDPRGRRWVDGKIRRIDGNRAEVAFGGTTRMLYLADLKDRGGRKLLPDPTDPAAFGALNRNSFWLLRDREWCRDFKRGDVVSLLSSVEDLGGHKANLGNFGRVVDTASTGQLILEMDNGKRISVSPRQVKQMRHVSSLKQLIDRVTYDPSTVYGTTSIITDEDGAEARIGIGGERKQRFMNVMFPNGAAYLKMESELFTGVFDDKATHNRTRMIMPMNAEDYEDREQRTLIPNESLFRVLQQMYPSAKRVMITRKMQLKPGVPLSTRPAGDVLQQPYTKDEIGEKVKRGERPKGGTYFDPFNVQKGARKHTRGDKTYYAPDGSIYDLDQQLADQRMVFDPESGQLVPADNEPQKSTFGQRLDRFSYLNPFRKDAQPTGPQLSYSAADAQAIREQTPVTMRIIVDPTDREVRENVGVVHEMGDLARQYSKWRDVTAKPASAFAVSSVDWTHRAKVTADATHMYVTLGEALANRPSEQFKDMIGQPLTFHDLVTMSLADKYMAWEKGGDSKQLAELLDMSSLFIYDSAHKRYVTNIANYDTAHKFLQKFFGKNGYEQYVFEDTDGAFATPAAERRLAEKADAYRKAYEETKKTDGDSPLAADLHGFRTAPLNDPLRYYQRDAINFMLENNHTLLANDQGTGKTASILAAIKGRMNRGQVKRALIVCPASLVTTVWPSEIENWCKDQVQVDKINKMNISEEAKARKIAQLPTTLQYHTLTTKNREDFFRQFAGGATGVAVTSFEMANLYGRELQKLGFDLVALDEAQNIKTGVTKTRRGSKRAETLKDVFMDVPVKIASTGTPIENSADDLHSIVSWLNPSLLGPAEAFAQDFIEVDYVKGADGKQQAVNVAVKKPVELMRRLRSVMIRTSKRQLEKGEQLTLKKAFKDAGREEDYNKFLHYGAVSPRLVYPIVSVAPDGALKVSPPSTDDTPPSLKDPSLYDFSHSDASLIDLTNPEVKTKYKDYIAAVQAANTHYTQHYKGGISQKTARYGTVNMKASALLTRMQQVLNDPSILGKEPEFQKNPLFNNPDMPNPKFDRLVSILDKHNRLPYKPNVAEFKYTPDPVKSSDDKKRKEALQSRGKTIIFCDSVEAIKALKHRLEKHNGGEYKGRILYYTGTENINELMGFKGNGKQTQQVVEKEFKQNPNYDILIANKAAETGLSFPQASLVVNYEQVWNPQAMNQRIDRAHRLGTQHRPVTALNIAVANTVEEKKLRAHAFKQQLFNDIIRTQEDQDLPDEYKMSSEALQQRKTLLGDDKAGLVAELIGSDPVLRNVQAASHESLMRARQVRAVSKNVMKGAAQVKRRGLFQKLSDWW